MRLLFFATLLLASCTSNRIAPVPDPLPENGAWQEASHTGAFLGLKVRANDSGTLDSLSFDPGVRVTGVIENSPASSAGLEVGDILLTVNDQELFDEEALDALLFAAEAGSHLELNIQRGDTAWRVNVKTAKRVGSASAEPKLLYVLDPQRSRAGWRSTPGGVRLVASAAGAPFPCAGIEVGSTIVRINAEPMRSARTLLDFLQKRNAGDEVEVEYMQPDGESATAEVTLFEADRQVTLASVPVLFHYESNLESDDSKFVLLDLWILSLFRYERTGREREWTLLSLFSFATGQGELQQ